MNQEQLNEHLAHCRRHRRESLGGFIRAGILGCACWMIAIFVQWLFDTEDMWPVVVSTVAAAVLWVLSFYEFHIYQQWNDLVTAWRKKGAE